MKLVCRNSATFPERLRKWKAESRRVHQVRLAATTAYQPGIGREPQRTMASSERDVIPRCRPTGDLPGTRSFFSLESEARGEGNWRGNAFESSLANLVMRTSLPFTFTLPYTFLARHSAALCPNGNKHLAVTSKLQCVTRPPCRW